MGTTPARLAAGSTPSASAVTRPTEPALTA
jgi:hypothetical protein